MSRQDVFGQVGRGQTNYFFCFGIFKKIIEIDVFNANSVDPDQTPRSAVSDLCLHCLPISLLRDAKHRSISERRVCLV